MAKAETVDPKTMIAVIIEAEVLNELDCPDELEPIVALASEKAARKILERYSVKERS